MFPKLYAVKSLNPLILGCCSSGGFISTLVQFFLSNDGIVYGAELGSDFIVRHVRIDNQKDFLRIAGSKYVASNMQGVLENIYSDLKQNKNILFVGTPCQCAGVQRIKESLKEESSGGLCIVDLVCHGTVTQKYFNAYLSFLSDRFGNITKFIFRDKKNYGLSCISSIEFIKNGKKKYKRLNSPRYNFYYYYMKADGFREICYNCKYTNLNRLGDFTVGDFWGIEKIDSRFDSSQGVSAVIVNSSKGEEFFERVKPFIEYKKENLNDYLPYNAALRDAVKRGNLYDKCQKMLMTGGGKLVFCKLYKISFKEKSKGVLKAFLPNSLKKFIRRIL